MNLDDKSLHLTSHQIEILTKLNLHDTDEVLAYYPLRYDYINALPFAEWKLKDKVTFEARLISPVRSFRRGRLTTSSFEVMMSDETLLKITIFNRPWAGQLHMDQILTIQGIYNGGSRVIAMTYDTKPLSEHAAVTPVYSTKEGIQQRSIRTIIRKVFDHVINEVQDIVPEEYVVRYRLLHRAQALERVHFPESMKDVTSAYRTLKDEEFLKFFTAMKLMRNEEGAGLYKQPLVIDHKKLQKVIDGLPYKLTADQEKALQDVVSDMESSHLMYRLVQGDVGCGKTAVAALSMYACATAGRQAALLAPTEILVRQHFLSLTSMFKDTDVKIAQLYSGMSNVEKEEVLLGLKDGSIDIVTGTHSLLQEDVVFQKLCLVVTDEQQRFGVEQRRALKNKGDYVDFLLMSATPIPRTLASTLYGDMEVSTIETMPAGRKTPVTIFINQNSFKSVYKDVLKLLAEGHQLYVICAAIDESEGFDVRNVMEMTQNLQKAFPDYKTGMLHGRMSSEEKQSVMKAFADNDIQILVSTTVVEVGMNVVNATGMIIYDADRFGLSQLHQLRGRIQRGSAQGHCWLLSGNKDEKVRERLNVLVKSCNGFEISYEDLRLRGPGAILGTRQSGAPDLILGSIVDDTAILNTARKDAAHIVENMEYPQYGAIIDFAMKRNASYVD